MGKPEVKVTKSSFQSACGKLNTVCTNLTSQQKSYRDMKKTLLQDWKGVALTPAEGDAKLLDEGLDDLITSLAELESDLQKIMNSFEEMDDKIKNEFEK